MCDRPLLRVLLQRGSISSSIVAFLLHSFAQAMELVDYGMTPAENQPTATKSGGDSRSGDGAQAESERGEVKEEPTAAMISKGAERNDQKKERSEADASDSDPELGKTTE